MTIGRDITAANAVLMLGITGLFDVPQQIQGFSADDVFDTEPIDAGEVLMGVDGKLSSGFIHKEVPWGITLMADSDSNDLFDQWYAAEKVAQSKFYAQATVILPALNKKWTMSHGVLTKFPSFPSGKKVLQPRKFMMVWEDVSPAPV